MFVRGFATSFNQEGPVLTSLANLFGPLRWALLALFISHGISFVVNFLGRKEYIGMTTQKLMSDPYQRIILMHVTIIFGGWLVMLLKAPILALALLILLKTGADLSAHQKQHATPQKA